MNNKNYSFPLMSSKVNMQNKLMDYKTLGIMTIFSNKKNDTEEGVEEMHRYLYKNRIIDNTHEIEGLSRNKINTVLKNIRKLSKIEGNSVLAANTPNGIVYYINYTSNGREFVTIKEDMLRYLINVSNSNTIKIYVLLSYLCSNGEKNVTREYIAEQIGLSKKSRSNLQEISDITDMLSSTGFIKIRQEYVTEARSDGSECTKKYNYYKINSHEDWMRKRIEKRKG